MTAILRILGWKADGLRCPDHEVDCCTSAGDPYPVSLVQMPNGTGKTTTLRLLRAALSGSGANGGWTDSDIQELRKSGSQAANGSFELRLQLDGRRVTIIMRFDFQGNRVYYKTTRDSGQVDGFDPPLEYRRFMNENFVKFFIFDGELAEQLLDRRHVQADAVVEALFQINSFRRVSKRVADYWEQSTRSASATEERGLTRRQNRLAMLRERLDHLESHRLQLLTQRQDRCARLEQQRAQYEQEIRREDRRSRLLEDATAKVDTLRVKVRDDALDLLDRMRDPHAMASVFSRMMQELKEGLDRVKLPESAAREFFEELSEEAECVCGTPIDEHLKLVIKGKAHQYLGSDDVSLLNSMKTAIQESRGQSNENPAQALAEKVRDLEGVAGESRDALNELDELKLEAEADPAVKLAKEGIDQLERLIAITDAELESLESKEDGGLSDEEVTGIDVLKRRLADAEAKLAEITRTIELRAKRDILHSILDQAQTEAREGISREVCADANRRVSELMPHNQIVIDRIDQCLILKGQEGGSVGENLSVAYGFLATLFNRSEHQLPFVVDSPAGSIDLAVRPKIADLIPQLTGQFIAFTISSERENFARRLKRDGGGPVQFITVFRKGSKSLEQMARSTSNHAETADGFVVHDEELFHSFQLDSEEI